MFFVLFVTVVDNDNDDADNLGTKKEDDEEISIANHGFR